MLQKIRFYKGNWAATIDVIELNNSPECKRLFFFSVSSENVWIVDDL